MNKKIIRSNMVKRTHLIDGLLSILERRVKKAERLLLEELVEGFVDKLQVTEGGQVRNTLHNKRMMASIDDVFDDFARTAGVELAKTVTEAITKIINFNGQYYRTFTTQAALLPISTTVKEFMSSWLGLTKDGKVKPNGYLDTLIKDTTVKNYVKDFGMRAVIGQRGWMESKKELKNIIVGAKGKTGRLRQYYRNFVYDTYSHVDRATAEVYAEKMGLNFAIYEGGIIKTTRTFCRERNGKTFHRSEIEKFDPKVAKPPNYNPMTDLGGYGCRHHLNWIPDTAARLYRDDVDSFK